jgi:hypothetical protein
MYYSIALGLILALSAFAAAAFIADKRYRPTFLAEPPDGRRHMDT